MAAEPGRVQEPAGLVEQRPEGFDRRAAQQLPGSSRPIRVNDADPEFHA
jgi:hypothetical protein